MPRLTGIDRATFLSHTGSLFAMAFLDASGMSRLVHVHADLEHPEPREGITSERVLTAEAIGEKLYSRKLVAASYEAAREYPVIFDGVACACSCGGKGGNHRSLLVCFETMQGSGCGACQEEAELVGKLAKEGKTLAEIRAEVDKKFG
jgi:thiol-disulfide isomerase/thioredoxin